MIKVPVSGEHKEWKVDGAIKIKINDSIARTSLLQ